MNPLIPQPSPDDWRVEWVRDGKREGRWLSPGSTRADAIRNALRSVNIFDMRSVSSITIRRRKEIERCPARDQKRVW